MKAPQQVAQLSDGTIANCIRQAQEEKGIFFGFDSSSFETVTAVRNELYQFTKNSNGKYLTWVDAFIGWTRQLKEHVNQELYAYCNRHVKLQQNMPMTFEIDLCGFTCIYPFGHYSLILKDEQLEQLNTLMIGE
ncbi:hypothetical protein ACPFUC_001892 [Vibrio cholerae]|jgi:hypothetical protein|nr:hypothetical protein [Vibrio cholerae]